MKIASFTFDDGLIDTADIVKSLNIISTFYIVTGWIDKSKNVIDKYNQDLDHGTYEKWMNLNIDIGSHSHCHTKEFNEKESYSNFLKYKKQPLNLSTPYGIKTKINFFDSCKIGYYKDYNNLDCNQLKEISSVNPLYDFEQKKVCEIIKKLPKNKWLVFTFHGINQGWKPITKKNLIFFYNFCLENGCVVKTVSEVVNEIRSGCYNIKSL